MALKIYKVTPEQFKKLAAGETIVVKIPDPNDVTKTIAVEYKYEADAVYNTTEKSNPIIIQVDSLQGTVDKNTQELEKLKTDTIPGLSKELNSAFALAQGKSTSYYSETIPENAKAGDTWFFTSTNKKAKIIINENEYGVGTLFQYTTAGKWVDISSEIVANKVTANYINGLNVATKKIEVYWSIGW